MGINYSIDEDEHYTDLSVAEDSKEYRYEYIKKVKIWKR